MPRKVFTAGEILTAADVNTNLMDQAVMVFDDDDARGSAIPSPIEGMVTYLKDTDALEQFDGSNFVAVSQPGILQVVSTDLASNFSASVASGVGVDVTGLAVSITPTSASSKIMVLWNLVGANGVSSAAPSIAGRIVRDSTEIGVGTVASRAPIGSGQVVLSSGTDQFGSAGQVFLDSPNTTSSTTYKIQIVNNTNTSTTLHVNRSLANSSAFHPTGMSSITVMEVAG